MAQAVIEDTGEWLARVRDGDGPERSVQSHKSPYNKSAWQELRDTKDAMAIARSRGNRTMVELLRELRPESLAPDPIFRWGHRSLPVADSQQVRTGHIDDLKWRYTNDDVANMTQQARDVWLNLAGIRLGEQLAGREVILTEGRSRSPRKNHRLYGMHAVRVLHQHGVLADDFPDDRYQDFKALLQGYDNLRESRDRLEEEVESIASRSLLNRPLMLGASALRGAYHLITLPINWAALRVYGRLRSWIAPTALEVRGGRRFAARAQVAVLALAAFGYIYMRTHGFRFSDMFGGAHAADISGLADPTLPGDIPTLTPDDITTPELPPTVPPPDISVDPPAPDFGYDARHTSVGEGWSEQLPQMQIEYSHDFMNSVGPWLEQKGYAYKYFDQNLGMWLWGMNLEDIDPDTLNELYDKAVEYGAAEPIIVAPQS